MDALIVGAGIAGPVTAMALQKAGISARIVEAHRLDGGDVGSYLSVSPNGLDALDVIGALPVARGRASPTGATSFGAVRDACSRTS